MKTGKKLYWMGIWMIALQPLGGWACPPEQPKQASYRVPIEEGMSEAFPVPVVSLLFTEAGARALEFQLPEDLAGPGAVVFRWTEEPGEGEIRSFRGSLGKAECVISRLSWECATHYVDSYAAVSDPAAVKEFLKVKYSDQPELLASKLGLLERFARDPEGILILEFDADLKQKVGTTYF